MDKTIEELITNMQDAIYQDVNVEIDIENWRKKLTIAFDRVQKETRAVDIEIIKALKFKPNGAIMDTEREKYNAVLNSAIIALGETGGTGDGESGG